MDDRLPLFVDLDNTLILGDTLWESFAMLVRQNPVAALTALFSLLRGRAAFKRTVARQAPFFPDLLQYNDQVVAFVCQEAALGRPTVLATAADARIADAVAAHLGCFTRVIASDGTRNLKGHRKLEVIAAFAEEATGKKAFDYIGDSRADRPIWQAAGRALVVAGDQATAQQIAGPTELALFLPRPLKVWRDLLKALRLHQWAKNILIFTPLLLSHQYSDIDKVFAALVGFVCFGLCASATYLWNDILDLPADRAHPRKQHRPLAAGRISIAESLGLSGLLLGLSFGLALPVLPPVAVLLLAGYIALTLAYSLLLKEKLLLDAMMLGLLFAYRILFGGVTTGIMVSDWLIAFSVFFFLGLALVKRYSEIITKMQNQTGKISGRGYYTEDREVIGVLGVASSYMSILIMALYITSPAVVGLYSHPQALWGVCLVMIYWISRIWVLSHRGHMPDDPIVFALRDRVSLLAGAGCVMAVLIAV
ncbi:UbiA family prenyltransferase [Desulfurivibrio alkaliphilus]|uniref:UbiA family prenyltransferase n=1 Tax=Desulfurivibrio alkaliphilus TaxID=427923 RepID=UPI0002DAED13|nr:UbiA family prenyltransferase [Desulfurivibrio alkaliphilus]